MAAKSSILASSIVIFFLYEIKKLQLNFSQGNTTYFGYFQNSIVKWTIKL